MALPVLSKNKAEGCQLTNNSKHCMVVLPGKNLSTNIRKQHVKARHPPGGGNLVVQSAKAVQNPAGEWFLIIRIKDVPHFRRDGSEEIDVTVTNPDTGQTSDPPIVVEVVYYEEEPIPPLPRKRRSTRRTGKTAPSVARAARSTSKSKGAKSKPAKKKKK